MVQGVNSIVLTLLPQCTQATKQGVNKVARNFHVKELWKMVPNHIIIFITAT